MKNKILKINAAIDTQLRDTTLTNLERQSDSKSCTSVFENRIGRQKAQGFDPFLSPKEAAQYLGVSARFIYERIFTGEIESQPVGRLKRIRLSTLENWLVRQQTGEKS